MGLQARAEQSGRKRSDGRQDDRASIRDLDAAAAAGEPDSLLYVAVEDPVDYMVRNDSENAAIGMRRFFCGQMDPYVCRLVEPEVLLEGKRRGFFMLPLYDKQQGMAGRLGSLPASWIEALRQRKAGLFLDHSTEGRPYVETASQEWHESLASYGVPPSTVVFVTQTRNYAQHYDDWCRAHGVAEKVHIFNYDYFVKLFFSHYNGDSTKANMAINARRQMFDEKVCEKAYVALNFKPRPWRIALLTHILRDGLWDEGFISFGGFENEEGLIKSKANVFKGSGPIEGFLELEVAQDCSDYLEALKAKGTILFGKDEGDSSGWINRPRNRVLDMDNDIYFRSAFSLIPETEMFPEFHRVTEKPFKAFANCHPMILFGNYRSLPLIHELGFKTFGKWIDESYDEIAEPNERFRAAYRAFREFLPKARTLVRDDAELRETLIFNMEHAVSTLPRRFTDIIDRQACRELAALLKD